MRQEWIAAACSVQYKLLGGRNVASNCDWGVLPCSCPLNIQNMALPGDRHSGNCSMSGSTFTVNLIALWVFNGTLLQTKYYKNLEKQKNLSQGPLISFFITSHNLIQQMDIAQFEQCDHHEGGTWLCNINGLSVMNLGTDTGMRNMANILSSTTSWDLNPIINRGVDTKV